MKPKMYPTPIKGIKIGYGDPDPKYTGKHTYVVSLLAYFNRHNFETPRTERILLGALETMAEEFDYELIAFCLAPSKVRMLVRGLAIHSDLYGFIKNFKRETEKNWRKNKHEPLWLPGFFDYVLTGSDKAKNTALFAKVVSSNKPIASILNHKS